MKFLIIDDSQVERYNLAVQLEALGYEVDRSEDTTQSIEQIKANNYDAIFLDVVMPGQDGYQLLREIRLNPDTAKQYIVLYSTKTTSIEIKYGLSRAGADDYLPKPVNSHKIDLVIQKILSSKNE
jgi:CheY-like chemotaxis protein